MKTFTVLCIAVIFASTSLRAQQRYIDEIFSDVEVVTDQEYGVNISVLIGGPESLLCDIYKPVGDTFTKRPLVVVLHNGTFLPQGAVAPTGDKNDYGNVEICRRLAKRGYVAASIQYRKGWIPTAQEDIIRRLTIINATYRGIQDVYGFLRYMNYTVANDGNPHGVDSDRVALFGLGTGAVIALNAAALNSVEETYIPKFTHPIDGTRFIDTNMVGDIHGIKQAAINIPNYVEYQDDFHFVFGIDGLVGDSTWLEIGTSVPLSVAGVVNHPSTPYGLDPQDMDMINCDLPVFAGSGTNTFVVNISGSVCIAAKANDLGINNDLNRCEYNDPVSQAIRNNPHVKEQEHLWGINLPGYQTGPWEYWDSTFWKTIPCLFGGSIHDCAKATNPDMSLDKANAYIDTLLWFFAPRAVAALNLDTTCLVAALGSEQVKKLEIMPNPVEDILYIRNPGNVWVFRLVNTLGQTLSETHSTGENLLSIRMGDFQPGLFALSAYAKNGHLIANARVLKN